MSYSNQKYLQNFKFVTRQARPAMFARDEARGILSSILFNMHVDDLILSLQNRGFGCYIKDIFEGCIVLMRPVGCSLRASHTTLESC